MAARSANRSAVVVASVSILTAPVAVTTHQASAVRRIGKVMTSATFIRPIRRRRSNSLSPEAH